MEYLGPIPIPEPVSSGLTFPITTEYGHSVTQAFPTVTHRFGSMATKASQTFKTGFGPRKFTVKRTNLSRSDRKLLFDFFDAVQGSYQSFTYHAPGADTYPTDYTVVFDQQPLSFQELVNATQVGLTLVEVPDTTTAPTGYTIASTDTRIPSDALSTALASDVQELIPLIHIKVREPGVADIYLSDRRCTVGGQLYLPRILGIGEPGSDVLISQNISGQADQVNFQLGNADRVMTALSNATDLKYAEISLSFYHVQSGILLQLWKGFIQTFQSDSSSSIFPVSCSDGLYQTTAQYPIQTVSRTCWKTYDDGVDCPYTAEGSLDTTNYPDAVADSCDYYHDSENGCQAHKMTEYFGGHPAQPQGVFIKDDSTGLFGWQRNRVTAVSIISDSVFGQPLPEIFCSESDPLYAMQVNALMVDYRDESTFADSLGIIGAGPIGKFAVDDPPVAGAKGGVLVTNKDGFKYIVAPMTDGFTAHGFKVDSNLNVDKASTAYGLRQVKGSDPAFPAQVAVGVVSGGTITYTSGDPFTDAWEGQSLLVGTSAEFAAMSLGLGYIVPTVLVTGVASDHLSLSVYPAPAAGSGKLCKTSTDSFSIGAGTPQVWLKDTYAAGTAFAEIRISKDSAIKPSTPDQHSMTVPISQGLGGRIWLADGSSEWQDGLSNPFDTAVNCYLRAIGLKPERADSDDKIAAQLASFVLPSLRSGDVDNLKCAEIADLMVDPLVQNIAGDTTEHQFRFQGRLAAQKPFRDWLAEILGTGLGFYTWEFGKLKLGCRINASAVSAFTYGNMLHQSLSLTPIDATFEHMVLDFADRDYAWQANTADYQDKSHAKYFNRAGAPLVARVHSVGCSSVSQGLRLAATRTREEIGGVNPVEWRNARMATWGTTILALDVEIGQVVALNDPMVPLHRSVVNVSGTTVTYVSGDVFSDSLVGETLVIGTASVLVDAVASDNSTLATHTAAGDGTGKKLVATEAKFRIQSFQLMKDYSIRLQAKTVCASMYDLDMGPKPIDQLPKPLPVMFYPQPQGEWAPFQIQAKSTDPLFPNEWSFQIRQKYTTGADGSSTATITAEGKLPVNQFIPNCGPVGITQGKITQSTTGGYLPRNTTLRVTLCARNADGVCTPTSKVVLVRTGSTTDTNAFTLHSVQWPLRTDLADYVLFVSDDDDLICAQPVPIPTDVLTAGTDPETYTPVDITCTGPLLRSTVATPNPNLTNVRLKTKTLWHGGVLGSLVNNVSGSTIQSDWAIDVDSIDNWAGRILTIIGRKDTTPFLSFNVTGYAPSTGTFTLDQACVTASTLDGSVSDSATLMVMTSASGFPATGQFRINIEDEMIQVVSRSGDNLTVLRGIDGSIAAAHASMVPVYLPDHSVQAGDAFVVSLLGYDNSATPYTFEDAGMSNSLNYDLLTHTPTPHSGLTPHAEKGYILRVLAGFNRGQRAKVVDNDATSYTLDVPFKIDETSKVIVEAAGWEFSADSSPVSNANSQTPASIDIPATNAQGFHVAMSLLVGGFTVDKNGIESEDGDGPFRMLYVFGSDTNETGPATADPNRPKYGLFQLKNLDVTSPTSQGTAEVHAVLAYIDELKVRRYATLTADVDGTTDPVVLHAAENADGVTAFDHFAVDDFIIFNDASSGYECVRITAINSGHDQFTCVRHWDGDADVTHACWGSTIAAHSTGVEIYKLDLKHDSIQSKAGSLVSLPVELTGVSQITNDLTTVLPHACVVSAMTATVSGGATSSWTLHNFSNPASFNIDQGIPSMPGIRTLIGGSYLMPPCVGEVAVGWESVPITLQDWASARCFFATCGTAPTGSAIGITLYIQYVGDTSWTSLATLSIPAGAKVSYGTAETPTQRNHPFATGWPVFAGDHRPLEGDALIKYVINSVGSTVPGSDLLVCAQT